MAAATNTPIAASIAPSPALAPALSSRQPSVSVQPTAPAASPSPLTPISVTTKEWVIPPRPKPGRKPAVDTPPTKRKAQNRAAQRAFRERRAARVGELEEQIRKIEDENERDEEALQEQITNLSSELEQCTGEISWWKERCRLLEKDVAVEKSAKEALVKEFRSSENQRGGQDTVPLTPRRSTRNKQTAPSGQRKSITREIEVAPGYESSFSPRHLGIETRFNMPRTTEVQEISSNPKRSHTTNQSGNTKRYRSDLVVKPDPEEMETDFTSRFASAPQTTTSSQAASPVAFDRCGFCQDGTACLCAEMAAEEETKKSNALETRLAPIQNISQFTPPPSDGDVRSELTLPSITNPCANGPGTCAQCVADPRSTLFCKSLAAARSAGVADSGCCGGKGSGPKDGCCQSRPHTRNLNRAANSNNSRSDSSNPSGPRGVSLSCADAFTTLSRHPNFSRANDELGSWLPRLQTLPNPQEVAPKDNQGQTIDSRPAMEVEAASVMGVLRYFDRRFSGNK